MNELLQVVGRCHPLVLHIPIGLVFAIVALELLSLLRREPLPRGLMGILVLLAAFAALVTMTTGLLLAESGEYSGETLSDHRALGIAVCVCAVLAGLSHRFTATHRLRREPGSPKAFLVYGVFLALTVVLILPTGHLGARLTHGPGFLTEPLRDHGRSHREDPLDEHVGAMVAESSEETGPDVPPDANLASYESEIAPIFAARCSKCHGEQKQKGGLNLATPEGIRAGGELGPVLGGGDPESSEILYRMRLPQDDDDHMPPEGKAQLSAQEVRLLEAWIGSGAPFESDFEISMHISHVEPAQLASEESSAEGSGSIQPAQELPLEAPVEAGTSENSSAPLVPDQAALDALTDAFVHVERIEPENNGLWIDFSAIASATDDALATRLLEPLAAHVVELNLSRTHVGGKTLELVRSMPRLVRLDLRSTAISDEALEELAGHEALEVLVLADTGASQTVVETLLTMPALQKLFTWNSKLSAADLERLTTALPKLIIHDGKHAAAAVLEEETAPTIPREPVNTKCPVTGSPIDPRFQVVHDKRVIGFCCAKCPSEFWADPARFADALE